MCMSQLAQVSAGGASVLLPSRVLLSKVLN